MKAGNLYIKYHHKAAPVIRKHRYPDRHLLAKWCKQYEVTGRDWKGISPDDFIDLQDSYTANQECR